MKYRKYFRKHIGTALRRISDRNRTMPFLMQVIQFFISIFLYLQNLPCALQIGLSGFRRYHTVLTPLEQWHPDLLLQLQQLLVQRRLREKQALCRAGNTPFVCDRQDVFNLF